MTGEAWLKADLAARYAYLCPRRYVDEPRHKPRKSSLLWVAWAREVYPRLPWVYRLVVDYAERSADDPALYGTDIPHSLSAGLEGIGYVDPGPEQEEGIRVLEARLWEDFGLRPHGDEPPYAPTDEVLGAIGQALFGTFLSRPPQNSRLPDAAQFAAFFRDIFGNPFRPVTFDSRWQTETVVVLATGIYTDCAFDRMPILADALEEAGCDNADILNHCRGEGPHVRGCWVVDMVLGKE
jgi:hypothetical protein